LEAGGISVGTVDLVGMNLAFFLQFSMQHFDGRWGLQMNVYAEIDVSKGATSKMANQAIISKLLR
jgi:hypothetical protein